MLNLIHNRLKERKKILLGVSKFPKLRRHRERKLKFDIEVECVCVWGGGGEGVTLANVKAFFEEKLMSSSIAATWLGRQLKFTTIIELFTMKFKFGMVPTVFYSEHNMTSGHRKSSHDQYSWFLFVTLTSYHFFSFLDKTPTPRVISKLRSAQYRSHLR